MATDELHMMDEVCVMAFGEDLGYWRIDELRSLEVTRLHKYKGELEVEQYF